MKTVKYLFTLSLFFVAYYIWQAQQQKAHDKEIAAQELEQARIQTIVDSLEEEFSKVDKKLNAKDFSGVTSAISSALASAKTNIIQTDQLLKSGQTFTQYLSNRKDNLLSRVNSQEEEIFESLKSGEITSVDFIKLAEDMSSFGFNGFSSRYKNEKETIDAKRIANASSWVRISISSPEPVYIEVIKAALKEKWKSAGDLSLVFGSPNSESEKAATFRVISIDIKESSELFQGGYKLGKVQTAEVLKGTNITFLTHKTESQATTWDTIEPIVVQVEVPNKVKLENFMHAHEVDKVIKSKREEIVQILKTELATRIPVFSLMEPPQDSPAQ